MEAVFGMWLIGALMSIRGFSLIFTTQDSIDRSSFYTSLAKIAPLDVWGLAFIVSAMIIVGSAVSQSIKKYYGLIIGNVIALVIGIPFVFISTIESHMIITQNTVTLVTFFNFILLMHSGVCVWKEKKRIRSLQK